jgi:hypothetical protein
MEKELHQNDNQTEEWILYLADQSRVPYSFQGRLPQQR